MTITLALLLLYSALQVGLGVWIGRRVRTGGDFFVAGRGLSAGLIFAAFLAANIGAGSTVGATAVGYSDGLSAWWRNGSAGIGSLLLAFWIGPLIWREAKTHGDLTVGDFLERHYGRTMRGVVGALIWCGTLSILAGQLKGIAAVLHVAGGVPAHYGYFAGALVAVAYFVAGGLLSSSWVNRVQLLFILIGFAIVTPVALGLAGGLSAVAAVPDAGFLGGGSAMGWRYIFILAPAFIVSPGLLQRSFAGRDASAVRTGIAVNGVVLLVFAFVPALLGMAAKLLYPDLAAPDLALPALMSGALPPAVGALALAAVFSAEISTADAVLFMLATSMSRDLYAGFMNRSATDAQMVRVARLGAVVGAGAGIALAFVFASVVAALDAFYALLTVTMFVPVIGALHTQTRGRDGLMAVAFGLPVLAAVYLLTDGRGYGVVTPALAGILASAAGFAASRILPR
ncbi:MAG: sodium:solute symporter family protein [Vicinamibacterales bacterium]